MTTYRNGRAITPDANRFAWADVQVGPKAPRREDGTFVYVRESYSWGKTTRSLVAAMSLRQAKELHGWTRNRYENIRVHRATVLEVEQFPDFMVPAVESEKDDAL